MTTTIKQTTQLALFEIGELSGLQEGFSVTPPRNPWGINFGGGLNSTAVILECIERQLRPDWIFTAAANNHHGMGGLGLFRGKLDQINNEISDRDSDDVVADGALEDRCHHGGCFT